MRSLRMIAAFASLFPGLLMPAPAVAAGRTIEFETTQVTAPDVALSPDGQWMIFSMVGHLFRLPVAGGAAEQLTSGPYYHMGPVVSPDGRRVAFASDRDGSEGNIFVLEIASGKVSRLTHESWAGRPAWTPDGQAIVYLDFVREAASGFSVPSRVRRVALGGGEPETVSAPPRPFRSVFYLPDGRLAWTVIEREQGSARATTRAEAMSPQGSVIHLRTLEGTADVVVASPAGDGLYCRRILTPQSGWHPEEEDLFFLPLPAGAEKLVTLLPPHENVRFAVAGDNKSLYLGESGSLWKVALPGGEREAIPFKAHVKLQIENPVAPPRPVLTVGSSPLLPAVLDPRLAPDGRSLVFVAAGHIWLQSLGSSLEPAKRLLEGAGFESWPAFSPDGRQLAFVHSQHGTAEIRVFDFASRQARTVAPGTGPPGWSPDGQRLVFRSAERGESFRVVSVGLSGGPAEQLAETGLWSPRPQFSADGRWLYFSASTSGTGALYRTALKEKGKPEAITQLSRNLSDGLVSADGRWLAFRRNREIWLAPLGKEPSVRDKDVRQISPDGGDGFAFAPDSSAVVYAVGHRVWRHTLRSGERSELPIRLELEDPAPPPVLLRNIRVLDFKAGGFGPETSLFIEHGRIRWTAPRPAHGLPPDTVELDAAGRFAIPGLFDMHVHLDRSWHSVGADQSAFLAYGVTSVRETGGEPTWTQSLAERSAATGDSLPRYFFAGELIEGAKSISGDLSLLIDNKTDARTYVRRLKDQGVHFLKAYATLPWHLHRAIADEARRLGIPVIGHGMTVEEVTRSVTLGYATLEHMPFANGYYDDVLQMLAGAGTRWDPTLAIGGGNAFLLQDEPERWRDTKVRAFATRNADGRGNACRASTSIRGSWVQQLASIAAAERRGVRLLAGTDSAHACVFYGSALQWELEHLVHAGLTPLEVLRIATEEAATVLGAQDDLGTLETGKLADIVLLDKNPLEDIRNTETIWRVIKGGWLFDPEKLHPPESTGTTK